jgi:3-hydroxyisobutyrate dehydrogenase-like beta-hydroxyacid dehydrogenase
VDLVDSPITQEQLHAIDDGGATLMVGSDKPAVLDKVLPLLKDMSSHVFPMGGLGAGHTMKTLNNYVSVGSIIALCDALVCLYPYFTATMLTASGDRPKAWPGPSDHDRYVDPSLFPQRQYSVRISSGFERSSSEDVMNVGTGVNFSTRYSMKNLKSYDTGYQLELLIKDVKIAKDVIEKSGFQSELPALALKYLEDSSKFVEKGADHSECLKGWENRADVDIKKTDPSYRAEEL